MTISIKPTASGSTIEQDGSTILTVDGSGNISTPNNLTVSGSLSAASGGGKVLQVINASYSTTTGSSTSTYANTGLTASITPSSTSSKILVIVHQEGLSKVTNSTGVDLKLFRGTTELALFGGNAGQQYTTAWNFVGGAGITYLDSPSTTSSTTYKTQFSSTGNNANVYVQSNNATSTITLMEIAG